MKKKVTPERLEKMEEQEILYTLLAEKVGAVDPRDVFYAKRIDTGKNAGKYTALLGGRKLTSHQLSQLQQEVGILEKTLWWKMVTDTLTHEAKLRMFKGMKTLDDSHFGKAILHAVGVIETVNDAIKHIAPDDTKT